MKKLLLLVLTLIFAFSLSACDNKYVVTFNIQEDVLYYEVECIENERLSFPSDPVIDGYTFGGWYTSDDYLVEVNDNQTCTKDFTFYGKLNQTGTSTNNSTYTIEFVDFDGTVLYTTGVEVGASLSNITIPSNPTRDGYVFDGWSASLPSIMPSNNVTITAIYTQSVSASIYTITYLDTDGNTVVTYDLEVGGSTDFITVPSLPEKLGLTIVDWNMNLPSVMPSENVTIEPIYYTSNTFTKELYSINEHEIFIEGDYILYMVNNWNWSVDESQRGPSTVNVLKMSDPSYHRVIDIDKANGYAYSMIVQDSKIFVSSPQVENEYGGSGALYFFDLEDESYRQEFFQPYSNVKNLGQTMVLNEEGTKLISSYEEYVASTDSTYDQFVMIDLTSTVPSVLGYVPDPHVSEHPWEMGGIAYKDFYVITKQLESDVVIEIRKFSDDAYLKTISLNAELATYGLGNVEAMVFYQQIENGVYINPATASGVDLFYSIDLKIEDPVVSIFQKEDVLGTYTGYMEYFHKLEVNGFTVLATSFWDGNTGTSTSVITIQDESGTLLETISGSYLYMTTLNNVLIISTTGYEESVNQNVTNIYMYDTSDSEGLIQLSFETFRSSREALIAFDDSSLLVLFVEYNEIDTFVYLDVENFIKD